VKSAKSEIPDYPLAHKDASEVTIRYTLVVMNAGTDLLSTSAFRYGLVLTDPFGTGRVRGTLEYTLDWLPAIVLTKPKVVYGAGVAPIGLRWNLCLAKTALGVIVTPHAAPARNSMGPVLDSQCAQHRENRLMCVGVRQHDMRREAI
jgi:hypothetical protein